MLELKNKYSVVTFGCKARNAKSGSKNKLCDLGQ